MLCAVTCVHDDNIFLASALGALTEIPKLVLISRKDWTGGSGNWETSVQIAEQAGAKVIFGDWTDETSHRRAALEAARQAGYGYAITFDSDEIIEPKLLRALVKIAASEIADRVYIEWDTYWKDCEHVIRPREPFTPLIMVNLEKVSHVHIREYEGGVPLFLSAAHGIVHHLSYVGPDSRIWKKITTWGHKDEILTGWWEKVWKGWDSDSMLRNLHPTHGENYKMAERIRVPEILSNVPNFPRKTFEVVATAHKCDIVIPAYGEQQALDRCLQSLVYCRDLIESIIVVDDASPEPIVCPPEVQLIRHTQNLGFAEACNTGYARTKSKTVLFLNSDTLVPKVALARLLATLWSSGSVAAAGPYTNNAGHSQQIAPNLTTIDNLDLFAEEFAHRSHQDQDVDMLVGFCLAVKKEVLEEVGLFDPRFGIGTFEDNDLSYRIRRAGYRLVISNRSFVFHEGSKTFKGLSVDMERILTANNRKFLDKWREDLDQGFASGLSGLSAQRLVFDQSRRPELRLEAIASKIKAADISLCMIVKNEEANIQACLSSVRPFVTEMLVLDTGSTDRTIEIAQSCGAVVRQIEWPDSFALARTESMREAKGKWILWVDGDDTLPVSSGITLIEAISAASENTIGFVMPVRFLESAGNGTEVDHVKVFRNLPNLAWEGRIHEQILPALRRSIPDGMLVRLPAHVLHSGYDTSESGQARKRERDTHLLKLDLNDRPEHPFVLFNLGMTAHYTDDHPGAVEWLRRSISAAQPSESHVRKAYALLVNSLRSVGEHDSAMDECLKGLQAVGEDPELLFLLGSLYANAGKHAEAIKAYQHSLGVDINGAFTSLDPGIRGWKTLHNLALSHLALGDWESAKSAWTAAMRGESRVEAAGALFAAALDQGDLKSAAEAFHWVIDNQGKTGMWPGMICDLLPRLGVDPIPVLISELQGNPWNDEARLKLANEYHRAGLTDLARQHYGVLESRGKASPYAVGLN